MPFGRQRSLPYKGTQGAAIKEPDVLILLAPGLQVDIAGARADLATTTPRFAREAAALAATARALSRAELSRVMAMTPRIAETTYARFQAFGGPGEETRAALFAYRGDTYRGLKPGIFAPDDLGFAQARLRILSGLYGLLRPLDAIAPHRLEMAARLKNACGDDLYAFWRDRLTEAINADLAALDTGTVLNLASAEYMRAIDEDRLRARLITPVFEEVRGGVPRVLALWTKRARGAMARYVIVNRIVEPDDIAAFGDGGYRFEPALSRPHSPRFRREGDRPDRATGRANRPPLRSARRPSRPRP